MLIVVYGGSGSGKSAYAEDLIIKENQLRYQGRLPMYYLATMQVIGEEGEERVRKHRKLREGKGFVTIEQEQDVAEIVQDESSVCFQYEKMDDGNKIVTANPYAVLLECMSNLVANEMFRENGVIAPDIVEEKIKKDLKLLMESCELLMVVTNNVFEDGIQYDTDTMNYLKVLARVNAFLAEQADEAVEVVAGIPVWIKPVRYMDYDLYKERENDQIWWVDNHMDYKGEHIFTFDKIHYYSLFRDYPYRLTEEEKKIFDKENPYWKDFFQWRERL